MHFFIGIDLAWGDKNLSGFSVLKEHENTLEILETKLLHSLNDILTEIDRYKNYKTSVAIDAPIVIPNDEGNREIEKEFISDFSKYKISMLPVNRRLLSQYSSHIRSEELYKQLVQRGYERSLDAKKRVFEVYPHSTIAVCFNSYKILPYKRKKGRDTAYIREQLKTYTTYLSNVMQEHAVFLTDIESIKGQALKSYEDQLDSITCAYTLYIVQKQRHKVYRLDGIPTFITPV